MEFRFPEKNIFPEMGTVETKSKTLLAEPAKPQVPKEKVFELGIDGSAGSVAGSEGAQENGNRVSVNGKEGLDGDLGGGFVEGVKNPVVGTEILVEEGLGGRDFDVLGGGEKGGLEDCEMKGVTSLLKMRESVNVVEVQDGGESESFKKLETLGVEGMASGGDGVSCVVDIGGGVSNKGVEERGHLGEEFGVKDNGGSLSENEQVPDGEIGIVEVPIEDMVVNNEMEEEEGVVDEGHEFSVGDFVWGKIRSHPWWPGQVYDPSDASDYAAKLKVKDRLLVAYFGDGTFAWCQPSQLKPFEENFEEMSRQSNSRTFVYAVHKAVDEISRLLELEMTCSCVTKENGNGLDRPLAVNAGIKDGVHVPEGRIGKLSNIMTEPVDLLGEVKQIAQTISFPSTLGLWVLKSRLAAFYRAKGGYPLPLFHELQPIPGLEDDLNYGAAGISNTVEVPIQGPFAEEWLSSPISPKFGQTGQTMLQRCLGNSDDRLHQRRKQKSIAEIMEGNNDVTAKGKDGDVAEEETTSGKLATSSARKKRKGIDETGAHLGNEATSVTRTKRKARMLGSPLSTNSKVSSVKNDGIGGKEETKKSSSSRRSKKNVDVSIGNDGVGAKDLSDDEPVSTKRKLNSGKVQTTDGEAKGKIEKGSLSRERKKSKYLSPPFTSLIGVQKKKDIEAESLKVSNEAQLGGQITTAAGHLAASPPILKHSRDKLQKKISPELGLWHEPSNISSPQTPKQDSIPVIDPMKVKAPSNQVLTQVRHAALNPTMENKSLEMLANFMSILRSSVYRDGSNYKAYNKRQTGRKRKNIDTEPGSLGKDQNHTDHKSPGHESKRRKINKNKEPEPNQAKPKKSAEIPDAKLKKPKSKQAAGKSNMKTSVKENEGEASAVAALFATFGPGSCLPTKADLLKIYGKFGSLNEAETDMFYNSFCARIAFIRSSDAEEALNQSLQSNPFKSAYVTFRLLYPKPGSKTREIREIPPPNAVSVPSVQGKTQEKSSDSQPLHLDYLKQKLEMMNSMLENSGGKVSPDTKGKLESEIKGLLEKLSTEPGSTSS